MGKVWDRGLDDATDLPEDRRDGPEDVNSSGSEDGSSGSEDGSSGSDEDHGDDPEDVSSSGSDEDHGDDPEDVSSSGSDEDTHTAGPRAVQLLSIRANFRISVIYGFDWRRYLGIYLVQEGEVQEVGMDLVLNGPRRMLEAYNLLGFEVYPADDTGIIEEYWSVVMDDDEVEEYTKTIDGGLGRKLEITYLVMPDPIETHIEVKLNLKDLGSRSRRVFGSIKASAIDFGSNKVHLFSRDRGRSSLFPGGSTCILPLNPSMIALPYRRHFKLHIEVDLRVITAYDSQEEGSQAKEEVNNLKFCLDFTRRVTRQQREVDGDQVEANVTWYLDNMST